MNGETLWRTALVQTAFVGGLFLILLALPLDEGFFEDWGFLAGPAAWVAGSLATARVVGLEPRRAALATIAGGLVAVAAVLVGAHTVGSPAAIAVFALVAAWEK